MTPDVPQTRHRFHIIFTLRYLRYGLVLCLVPMVQALFAWDWQALIFALWQDTAILLFSGGAALFLWLVTSYDFAPDGIVIQQGVLVQSRRFFAADSVAALEISRPLYCRLLGASILKLYFKTQAAPHTYQLYLPKKAAQHTAETLLPVRADSSVFAPTGFEKMAFVMLSANVLTSVLFISMGFRRISEIFGQNLQNIAFENFSKLTALASHFLPAGLAFVTAALFVVLSFTFLYALLHTAGFTVCRNGGVIIMRGGLITKIERRIAVLSVSACDVRVTPVARLLRRYPVYISAGSFHGGDIPLLVFKKNAPQMMTALLANFTPPSQKLCEPSRKSIPQYLWKPAVCLALSLAVYGVALTIMPQLLPMLAVPVLLSFAALAQSLEGFLKEGVCKNENRTLSLCFTRFFTRHEVCVFAADTSYTLVAHSLSISAGRCDFYVHLPCRLRYHVRGILRYVADDIPFIL
ncbi:MAG: hypothetical protein RR709_01835 [Ruthenibacterium sp.]